MKYIAGFITDTHLSKNNVELNLSIFQQALYICMNYGIPLYHGGDFLEERKRLQDFDVKEGFESILKIFSDEDFVLNGICGNHDKLNYESESNWLTQYRHNPGFRLVSDYAYDDFEGIRLHLLPYFLEGDTYLSYLNRSKENLHSTKANILLTHISITGASNNDGSKVSNSLSLKDFKEFDLVLSGHYHEKQTIGNFIYFGSAYQRNFGESNDKGLTLLKEDGTLDFVKLDFPEYKTIKIDIDENSQEEVVNIAKPYFNSSDNIRFELTGEESKVKAFNKELLRSEGIRVDTKTKEVEDNIEFITTEEIVQFNKESIYSEFDKFCEKEELDRDKGLKYLKKKLG